MRVGVIGAGIAGHGAALALADLPGIEVVLFEASERAGGHARTMDIDYNGRSIAVDTGFIVYNELNYPELTAFFRWAGVKTRASDMSFALSVNEGAFEWSGRDENPLGAFFAQRRNLLSPSHWAFLRDVLAFQKMARADIAAGDIPDVTLGEYLMHRGVGERVRDDYIAPMGAAIWSMTPDKTLEFPARSFFAFFENHKLLQWDRPRWRTVSGGSRVYVAAIGRLLGDRLKTGRGVRRIARENGGVTIEDSTGEKHAFDMAIAAVRPPAALAILSDASAREREVLSAFRVSDNLAFLHRDERLMPRRKAAWASWNVMRDSGEKGLTLTYWMNRLQGIDASRPLFVTLNPARPPAPELIFDTHAFEHPLFDAAAIAAQTRMPEIQGQNKVWFCGAWTGFGFHEDGLRSGLAAAEALGGRAPWRRGT